MKSRFFVRVLTLFIYRKFMYSTVRLYRVKCSSDANTKCLYSHGKVFPQGAFHLIKETAQLNLFLSWKVLNRPVKRMRTNSIMMSNKFCYTPLYTY